jgi:hypothetical protein
LNLELSRCLRLAAALNLSLRGGLSVFRSSKGMCLMEKKTVRAGLVGSGFSSTFHFEALQKVYGVNVEVVGVFTKDADGGKAYAEKRGIRAFPSLGDLFGEVDAVHVCVPPVAHEPTAIAALERGKFVICEKPLTGYFGDGSADFHWARADMEVALETALASIDRILEAERNSKGRLLYAENWVYAPAVQKEREILEKTAGQILWIHGEEAHSGSHSAATYAYCRPFCGGGVHDRQGLPSADRGPVPEARGRPSSNAAASPIQSAGRSARRTHAITRTARLSRSKGTSAADYHDIDDFAMPCTSIFEDGTIADDRRQRHRARRHPQLAGGQRQQPPDDLQHQSEQRRCRPTMPVRGQLRRISTSWRRSGRGRAGRTRRPTKTGSPATRRRWRRSTGRSPTVEPPRERQPCWRPTAISTIYSAYLSARRAGAAVDVRVFEGLGKREPDER